jgi:hypothetical protein
MMKQFYIYILKLELIDNNNPLWEDLYEELTA